MLALTKGRRSAIVFLNLHTSNQCDWDQKSYLLIALGIDCNITVLVFTIWPITMNKHVLYSQPKMWLSKHITRCWLQATSSAFRLHLISRKIWMKRDYRLLRAIQSFSDRLPTSDRNPFSRAAGSSFAMISRAGAVQAAMENWSRRVNTAAKLRWCRQWCICVSGSFVFVCTWTYTTYSCKSAASWGSTLNNYKFSH